MSKESREYTHDEMKQQFIEHIHHLIHYWEHEDRVPDVRGKLEGLAFSILSTIDGSSAALPSYALIPLGNKEDTEYHISCGENYYSEKAEDIAGSLHDCFYDYKPK